jgi:flagellar biosynthesis/type III secretory pathway chaperone
MGMAELSNALWRERELLEILLFKLEEEQLLLAAGRSEWLARATREVEVVLEAIADSELVRAVEVDLVSASLGLTSGSSLGELSRTAPAPWDELLADHRRAFLELTARIAALSEANRDLISRGQRAVAEALSAVAGPVEPQIYGPSGTTVAKNSRRHFLDGAI